MNFYLDLQRKWKKKKKNHEKKVKSAPVQYTKYKTVK